MAEADGFDYERFAALFRQQSGFPPEAKVPDPIEVQNMIARSTRRNGYGQ